MYGDAQKQVFAERGAVETRTHDMLVPVSRLTDGEREALLAMRMEGTGPTRRGDDILVPCFWRPATAEVLACSPDSL
jgi:hypothetical protein